MTGISKKSKDNDGYLHVYVNKEMKSEHRYIMQQYLGRPLKTDEHVHHINRDRSDNSIENLKLMSKKDHMEYHYKNVIKKERKKPELYLPYGKFLTSKQVAEMLQVHVNTIRAWDKKLNVIRLGVRGHRRYKKEDVEKFINTK